MTPTQAIARLAFMLSTVTEIWRERWQSECPDGVPAFDSWQKNRRA